MIKVKSVNNHDFQTPPEVCRYMAQMIPTDSLYVLEPTPGAGNLVSAIKETRPDCVVIAPEDFFLMEKQRFDCVVMNPPFSPPSANLNNAPEMGGGMRVGYFFLTECMKMSDNVIALMSWFTISDSDVRLRYFADFGIVSVTPLPRNTFTYARIQTVVIQFKKGYCGVTKFYTRFHKKTNYKGGVKYAPKPEKLIQESLAI